MKPFTHIKKLSATVRKSVKAVIAWGRRLFSSMAAQMILVVLLALVVAQVISFLILGNAYRTVVSDINQKSQFQQIDSLVLLLEASDVGNYPAILAASSTKNAWFSVDDSSSVPSQGMNLREQRLVQRLLHYMGREYRGRVFIKANTKTFTPKRPPVREEVKACSDPGASGKDCKPPWRHHPMGEDGADRRMIARTMMKEGWRPPRLISLRVSVQMLNGHWLNLQAKAPVAPPLAPRQTLVFLALSSVFVLLALAFMVRRITRPLGMLSRASVRLGLGEEVQPLPEKGPEDLRETIRTFNQMNDRLQRFVSDRTRMLAALSHDLRTPITSMRLRVELMPESRDRNQLLATLEEMQQMSEATLAFMRQASDNEQTRQVDLNAMLGSLCDDLAELGQDVHYREGSETIIRCRPVSLKRAFRNLIENAVKYGNQAEVSFAITEDKSGQKHRVITIQDVGPGIPEAKMEQVFEPFFRLEGSRNRDTGGIGLGMAIARNIVRNHGGDIELVNREKGLQVRVMLPENG